ncbi:MAG: hypothetical protein U1E65_20250 [Myxococcota bacterium]
MRGWLLALGSIACVCQACTRAQLDVIAPELPSNLTAVAVGVTSAARTIWTPLQLMDGSAVIRADLLGDDGGARSVRLVGFTAADLAGLDLSDHALIEETPLSLAPPNEPRLPSASYVADGEVRAGSAIVHRVTEEVELTAAWLPDCPVPFGGSTRVAVSLSCDERPCAGVATVERCGVEIRSPDPCLATDLSLRIDGRGEVVGAEAPPFTNCTTSSAPGALFSLDCLSAEAFTCNLRGFLPEGPPPVTVERIALESGLPVAGATSGVPWDGYLSGIAALSDRVVVTGYGRRPREAPTCRSLPGRLYSLRYDAPQTVTTTSAPACMHALVADGDRLYLSYGADVLSFGELGLDGRVLRHVELSTRTAGLPAVEDAVSKDGMLYLLLRFPGRTELWHMDPRDFSVQRRVMIESDKAQSMTMGDGFVAVGDDKNDGMELVDLRTDAVTFLSFRPDIIRSPHKNPGLLLYHPQSATTLVSVLQPDAAIWSVRGGHALGYGRYAETYGEPTAMIDWRPDPSRVLVALLLDLGELGGFALYEPATRAFLPGTTRVPGVGQIAKLVVDPEGVVWGIAPWTAELLRVRAR